MRLTKTYQFVFLLLLLLAFYGLKILPVKQTNWNYPLTLVLFVLTTYSINTRLLYSKIVLLYASFVLVSCIYSWVYHEQELYIVVVHSYAYFGVLFFLYLVKCNPSAKEAEKILLAMAFICCGCYILQWLIYPIVIFSGSDSESKALLEYRVRIPGSIGCYCLLLYGVNKYLLQKQVRYLFYALLGLVPIIIMGFRTLNALSLLAVFFMIPFVLRRFDKTVLYGLLGIIAVLLLMQTPLAKSKLTEMEGRNTEGQTFDNEDYVRYISLDYYWNEQFADPVEKFWGGGVPADVSSKYNEMIKGWAYSKGLFWNDLGLLGLSMIIGIPAVLLLILMYMLCIWRCKEPRIQYLRFTLLIVLPGSVFTTAELFREGNILLLSLFLYIEYKYHQEVLERNGCVKNVLS